MMSSLVDLATILFAAGLIGLLFHAASNSEYDRSRKHRRTVRPPIPPDAYSDDYSWCTAEDTTADDTKKDKSVVVTGTKGAVERDKSRRKSTGRLFEFEPPSTEETREPLVGELIPYKPLPLPLHIAINVTHIPFIDDEDLPF